MFMKKKFIYSILLIFTCLIMIFPIATKADSGWDSDYDSGGWDSGSSWDSGSGWGSSGSDWYYYGDSGSSSGSGFVGLFVGIIFLVVIAVIVFSNNKPKGPKSGSSIDNNINISNNSNSNYQDIEQSKIDEIDPSIKIEEFKNKAFNIYKDIQGAWMNFDTDKIRKLTTDEIYNMYSSQLETLKLKNQKNIMKNIEYVDAKIIDITNVNGVITINVYLRVKVLDYVINVKTNKTVRGRDNVRLDIEYNLTFVKSETDDKKIETCPNCGAPVDIVSSATCPYCNSTLVKTASDYVMSKKTCIGQRLDI